MKLTPEETEQLAEALTLGESKDKMTSDGSAERQQINRLHDILACALKACEKGARCAYDASERSGYEMVVNMIRAYERETFPPNSD